jgi:quercetin dioxygenase-like cupin family protein
MIAAAVIRPRVVAPTTEPLWFLGTVVRLKLTGEETGGRFAIWEAVFPHGAAPPLHSHPQDETFVVLDGELTAWVAEDGHATEGSDAGGHGAASLRTRAHRCGVGATVFAPGGAPHSFRVESDTARVLFLSTPAGIEDYVRALAEPARWPWLQPPQEGPRVSIERLQAVEREHGVTRFGPPPTT